MKKKRVLAAVLALTMVCSLTASAKSNKLKFFTGGDQGVYYSFGKVLADVISETTNDTTGYRTYVTVKTSGGSDDNISNIKSGKADIALAQSDVISYAYNGTRTYSGNAVTDFSVIAALYSEQVQIVTCDPDIQTVEDLKGKTVSIGAEGSGVYYNAMDILDSYGMDDRDISAVYQGFGESSDSLADGSIDAAFIVAGTPTQAVTFLSEENSDMHLISLDDEHIEKLLEKSPYYSESVITADVYGTDEDTTSVDVDAVLITNNKETDDDIYNIVANIFDNIDEIAEQDDKGAELNMDMGAGVTGVPYHPGAVKYWEEQGYEVYTG